MPTSRKVGLGATHGSYLYEALEPLSCSGCKRTIDPGERFTRAGVPTGGSYLTPGSGLVAFCSDCEPLPDTSSGLPSPADLDRLAALVSAEDASLVRNELGRKAQRALGALGLALDRADWVSEDDVAALVAQKRSTAAMLIHELHWLGLVEYRRGDPYPRAPGAIRAVTAPARRTALLALLALGEMHPTDELCDLAERAVRASVETPERDAARLAAELAPDPAVCGALVSANRGIARVRTGGHSTPRREPPEIIVHDTLRAVIEHAR